MTRLMTRIRVAEFTVITFTTLLAVQSFLSSSLYETAKKTVTFAKQRLDISTSLNTEVFLAVAVLLIVFLLVYRDLLEGKEANIGKIFELHVFLVTPEILSHSKLNWLALLGLETLLEPIRSPGYVFAIGALIVGGWLTLLNTARARGLVEEFTGRGADVDDIKRTVEGFSRYNMVMVSASMLVGGVLFLVVPPGISLLLSVIGQMYPVYVAAFAVTLIAAVFYLRSTENGVERV